jgi:putative FmdB family regulatory protein
MPIYEYECLRCGAKFERRRNITDSDTEINCPKCGAKDARRLFSTFATASSNGGCVTDGST